MATIEAALYTRLSGFAGLAALVSTRIYPLLLPQSPTYPAISYFLVGDNRSHKMGIDSQVVQSHWQFDVWGTKTGAGATTYTQIVAVRRQLRLALQRWRNASAPVVQDTLILDEADQAEDTPESTIVQHLTLDAEIWFDE